MDYQDPIKLIRFLFVFFVILVVFIVIMEITDWNIFLSEETKRMQKEFYEKLAESREHRKKTDQELIDTQKRIEEIDKMIEKQLQKHPVEGKYSRYNYTYIK